MRTALAALALCAFVAPAAAREADAIERFDDKDVFELEYAADPQISPEGTMVAYVRRSNDIMIDNARGNIWVVSTDTGEHRPLLSGRKNYSSPRWSPSGDRLAFVTGAEGGKPQLYVRWMDTGQTALLTNLTQAPQSIAWSPDGTQIAFAMFVEDKKPSLAKAPKKPEGAKWAPPVKVIEDVVYRQDGGGYTKPGYTHVFVVPADGGTPRQLTNGDFNHTGPLSWSADGSSIYFSANRNDDWKRDPVESEIWRIDVVDGTLAPMTDRDGPDFSPAVSPDGARVAYLGFDDKKLGYHTTRAYVMGADGSNRVNLTGEFDRQ
ncbi:MAG: TolB family protein, partial [Hyphococcus sp.]